MSSDSGTDYGVSEWQVEAAARSVWWGQGRRASVMGQGAQPMGKDRHNGQCDGTRGTANMARQRHGQRGGNDGLERQHQRWKERGQETCGGRVTARQASGQQASAADEEAGWCIMIG